VFINEFIFSPQTNGVTDNEGWEIAASAGINIDGFTLTYFASGLTFTVTIGTSTVIQSQSNGLGFVWVPSDNTIDNTNVKSCYGLALQDPNGVLLDLIGVGCAINITTLPGNPTAPHLISSIATSNANTTCQRQGSGMISGDFTFTCAIPYTHQYSVTDTAVLAQGAINTGQTASPTPAELLSSDLNVYSPAGGNIFFLPYNLTLGQSVYFKADGTVSSSNQVCIYGSNGTIMQGGTPSFTLSSPFDWALFVYDSNANQSFWAVFSDSFFFVMISNANVVANAEIAYSKLNLTGQIQNSDLAGGITDSKLNQITTVNKVASSSNVDLAAATNYAIPNTLVKRDSSGSANFYSLLLNSTASQLTFLSGLFSLTLNATTPATASWTVTLPDPGANANVIYDVSAQTLTGAKTFNALLTANGGISAASLSVSGLITANTLNASGLINANGGLTATFFIVTQNFIVDQNETVGNTLLVNQIQPTTQTGTLTIGIFGTTTNVQGCVFTSTGQLSCSLISTVNMNASGLVNANGGLTSTTFLATGLITANAGISTTSLSASGLITANTLNASGLINANGGLTSTTFLATGAVTANAGISTTSLSASGLITANTMNASGLINANGGLTATVFTVTQNFIVDQNETIENTLLVNQIQPLTQSGTLTIGIFGTTTNIQGCVFTSTGQLVCTLITTTNLNSSGVINANGGLKATTVVSTAGVTTTSLTATGLSTLTTVNASGLVNANGGLDATTITATGIIDANGGEVASFLNVTGLLAAGAILTNSISSGFVDTSSIICTGLISGNSLFSSTSTTTGTLSSSGLITATSGMTAGGLITANAGITTTTLTASGLSTLTTVNASGLVNANAGLDATTIISTSGITTTSLTSSTLITANNVNVSGLLNANGGLTAFSITTGPVTVLGTLTANSIVSNFGITAGSLITANGGMATTSLSASTFVTIAGLLTANGGILAANVTSTGLITANGGISTTTLVASGLITANGGITTANLTSSGLITGNGGISTTTITASGLITANGGITTTTITASGLITANGGITTTSLTSSTLITANNVNVSGLLNANGGLSATTVTTSSYILSSGTVYANNGLVVVGASTFSLLITANGGITTTTITASGLITANGGITTTTITASGLITANGGILLPTTGGTAATLNYYETFTDTTTNGWSGPSGTFTNNIKYTRIGDTVTISFNVFNPVTATSTTHFQSPVIPSRFRPSQQYIQTAGRVTVGGVESWGFWIYDISTTTLQCYKDVTQANFASGTSAGYSEFAWTWSVF
jgi:hypothetical protein